MPPIEIRQRKNGNKFVRVITGYDESGKPIRQSHTFPEDTPKTEIASWIALVSKKGNKSRITQSNSGHTILSVYQKYEQTRDDLKVNTIRRQRMSLKYLRTGKQDINSFTPTRLQKILNDAPLALSTKRVLRAFISVLFGFATEQGYIKNNPASSLRLPKRERSRVNRVLDAKQLETLKSGLDLSSEIDVAILTLMVTGLRAGELLALEPKHLQGNKLRIEGTLAPLIQPPNGKRYVTSPKTVSSVRTVTIPDYLVDVLNRYDGEYLFMCSYQRIKRRLLNLCKGLGLPEIKPHGLRHSHATYLLSKNIPLPAIASRLGHSNPSITLSTYSHLVDSMSEQILAVL